MQPVQNIEIQEILQQIPREEELKIVISKSKTYLDKNGYSDIIGKRIEYLTEHPDVTVNIIGYSISRIATCTMAGGAGGALIGRVAYGEKGVIPGFSIGYKVGLFTGIYLSAKKTIIEITVSSKFLIWKAKAIQEKVYPIFQEFLEDEEEFRDLVCPITDTLITVPMESPNGHVYEKVAIETWLDNKELETENFRKQIENAASQAEKRVLSEKMEKIKETICPSRGKPFKKEDLIFNVKYVKKTINTCAKILSKRLPKNKEKYPIIKKGLTHICEDLMLNNGSILSESSKQLTEQCYQQSVNADTFADMQKALYLKHQIAD